MKLFYTSLLTLLFFQLHSQSSIKGQLQDAEDAAVGFANVALFSQADSSVVKVEISDESGVFRIEGIPSGNYFLVASFVGQPDLRQPDITLTEGQVLDLGVLQFSPGTVELTQATVTAQRAMVEVKPDRTVFNVDGTINSVGSDAIELLRKAPGVVIDNNDNINVLGRSGVLVYVDGKRLPLGGQDLANYLKNLQADQIDRFDIITNPGAKYEAEGNAGIIDIRLKKDKNLGANGSLNLTGSQGKYAKGNGSISGNYRNKFMNTFVTVGGAKGENFNEIYFDGTQYGIVIDEDNEMLNDWENINWRVGTDFFVAKNHTVGFIVTGMEMNGGRNTYNRVALSTVDNPTQIDSILEARNTQDDERSNYTYNLNYRFDNKKQSLNFDLDYGNYDFVTDRYQPNLYFDAEGNPLSTNIDLYETMTDIDIYTAKADYEQDLMGGRLGFGSKLSRVVSDNDFLVFDEVGGEAVQNNVNSNVFEYTENVYAGYVNYARPISEKWNFSAGLRAEQTDATGNLMAFLDSLQEDPVDLNYLSWFPSAGLTYQVNPRNSLSLNYGRRINRPDYNVLNPFNNRLSELSYEKGNPRLNPEIVNNFELGWTYQYRYNFKIAYSHTIDQITRLIGPDDVDERASFITWANLATQDIWSASASLPFQFKEGWNAYFSLSASYIDNQATYPDGGEVDIQAGTYNVYTQHTIDLPYGFKGEISGWYSGPGVWGGVFLYDPSWSLNIGLQRKFLQDKLNMRLSANDLFYETGWSGESEFNGLVSTGSGNWDSRRVSLSLNYIFGNQNVKSRKRKTGLEDEADRVGD